MFKYLGIFLFIFSAVLSNVCYAYTLLVVQNTQSSGISESSILNSTNSDKLVNIQEWANRLAEKERVLNLREQQLQEKERQLTILMKEIKKESDKLVLQKKRMDEDIARQRAEMNDNYTKQKQELLTIKNEIESLKKVVETSEDANLDKLANFYSNTKPKDAARIISKMDLMKAVKLFQRMRPMAAGEILSALGRIAPDFASKISEALSPSDNITNQNIKP